MARPSLIIRVASVAALAGALAAGGHAAGVPAHLPVTDLRIETAGGTRDFRVSVASRPADRRRGLMHVTELQNDEGMLFDFGGTSIQSMWMKNTPLSLDMLFIRQDGTISSIASHTVPYTRTPIFSEEPVRAVLELRGGACELFGIAPGDTVVHAIFAGRRPASAD